MGGGTGNIRTLRNQSGSNGSRTWASILASDGANGAGSVRRIYGYYARLGQQQEFFETVLHIARRRSNWQFAMM